MLKKEAKETSMKNVGSHAQFVNALWWAVVRAQELLEEAA